MFEDCEDGIETDAKVELLEPVASLTSAHAFPTSAISAAAPA